MRAFFAAAALIALASPAAFTQEAKYQDPGFQRLAQVAIVCRDIDASAKRWAALLGVETPKVSTTLPGSRTRMMYRGKASNGQVKLAFFKVGQVQIELMQPVGGDTSWREHLDKFGEGVHHIAFQIEDVDKTVKRMEALGMPVVHSGRYDSDNGTYIYLDSKPSLGVMLELLHSDK